MQLAGRGAAAAAHWLLRSWGPPPLAAWLTSANVFCTLSEEVEAAALSLQPADARACKRVGGTRWRPQEAGQSHEVGCTPSGSSLKRYAHVWFWWRTCLHMLTLAYASASAVAWRRGGKSKWQLKGGRGRANGS